MIFFVAYFGRGLWFLPFILKGVAVDKDTIIKLENVSKDFDTKEGKLRALSGIDLEIEEGDIYGIIGLSGAGKSTLVRCINLLETPTEGRVIFENRHLTDISVKDLNLERRKIAMIFQQFNLLMQRTALDNVCFPMEIAGISKSKARKKALDLLKIVDLEDRKDAYPKALSGGQKQRVAIARALAAGPKVLLCDEATSALDPKTTQSILDLLKKINKEYGITIVIITHEMSVVKQVCNKVAIIEKGEIVERGEVDEIFRKPKTEAARRLFLPEEEEKKDKLVTNSKHRVRLAFDETAYEPRIADMILKLQAPVNILYANMQIVDGKQKGQMVLSLADDAEKAEAQKNYLRENNIAFIELYEGGDK